MCCCAFVGGGEGGFSGLPGNRKEVSNNKWNTKYVVKWGRSMRTCLITVWTVLFHWKQYLTDVEWLSSFVMCICSLHINVCYFVCDATFLFRGHISVNSCHKCSSRKWKQIRGQTANVGTTLIVTLWMWRSYI